jgi:hypothetical protein
MPYVDIFAATTTTSTTILTTTDYYFPCRSNFAIVIDASGGLTSVQFDQQINFITSSLLNQTQNWTHLERATAARYGRALEFTASSYNLNSNLDDYRYMIESLGYIGVSTPNITR